MRQFAEEVSRLTHGLCAGADVAEKIASAEGSDATQNVVSQGSYDLYSVIVKQAADTGTPAVAHHRQVVDCVVKIAQALGRPIPNLRLQHKLAAVVAADDALMLTAKAEGANREKLASMQRFGREFFVSLLEGIV